MNFSQRLVRFTLTFITALLFTSCNAGYLPIPIVGGSASTTSGVTSGTQSTLPAASLTISGASTVTAGVCSLYYVQGLDSNSAPSANFPAGAVIQLSGSGDSIGIGHFSSMVSGGDDISSVSIASSNQASFYFCGTKINVPYILVGSYSPSVSGSLTVMVSGGTPASVQVTGSSSQSINSCQQYAVVVLDQYNNVTMPGGISVNVSATNNALLYGSQNASCSGAGSSSTSVSIGGSMTSNVFYMYPQTAGSVILTPSSGSLTPLSLSVTVNPGNLLNMGFTISNSTTVGNCINGTLNIVDANEVARPVAQNTQITFTGGSNSKLYAGNNCSASTYNQGLSIPENQSSATFSILDNVVESPTFVASSNNSDIQGNSFQVSWGIGNATQAVVGFSQASTTAGTCVPVSISLKDSSGNTANALATLTFNWLPAPSQVFANNVTFYSSMDSSGDCSIPVTNPTIGIAQSSATYYVLPSVSGTLLLNVSVASPAGSGIIGQQGSLQVNSAIVNPMYLNITTSDPTITTDSCAHFTVTAEDANHNPIDVNEASTGYLQLALSSPTTSKVAFYSDKCATRSSLVTIAQGTSSEDFWMTTGFVGSLTIQAASPSISGTIQVTSNVGNPKYVVFNVSTSIGTNRCIQGSLSVTDAANNAITLPAGSVALISSLYPSTQPPATPISFFSDIACATPGSSLAFYNASSNSPSTAAFSMSAVSTGQPSLYATVSTASGTLPLYVSADTTQLKLVAVNPSSTFPVQAVAGNCRELQAEITDGTNILTDIVPTQITLTAPSSVGNALYSEQTCTNRFPASTPIMITSSQNPISLWIKDTKAEAVNVTANGGATLEDSEQVIFSAGAATAKVSGPASYLTQKCQTGFSVMASDTYGNQVAAKINLKPVVLTDTVFYSDANCNSIAASLTTNGLNATSFSVKSPTQGQLDIQTSGSGLSQLDNYFNAVPSQLQWQQLAGGSLSFGQVPLGQAPQLPYSVTNNGTLPVVLSSISISGDASFTIVSDSCSSLPTASYPLAAGQGCMVMVQFKPTQINASPVSATLTAVSDSGNAVGTATGQGIAAPNPAKLAFQLSTVSFPSTLEKTMSAPMSITLQNTGNLSAAITSAAPSNGNFVNVTAGTTCGTSLAGGASCVYMVAADPLSTGTITGSFAVASPQGAPSPAALSVVGLAPASFSFAGPLSFGGQTINTFPYLDLSITNGGDVTGTISSFSFSGSAGFYSIISGGSCAALPATVSAHATCSIRIQFAPKTTASYPSTITLLTSSGNGEAATTISGYGVTAGSLSANPASWPFGFVSAPNSSEKCVAFSNGGETSLTINGAGNNPFQFLYGTQFSSVPDANCAPIACNAGTVLNPGQSCGLGVIFKPTSNTPGGTSDLLTVNYSSAGIAGKVQFGMSGNGVIPLTCSPYVNGSATNQAVTQIGIDTSGNAYGQSYWQSIDSRTNLPAGIPANGVQIRAGDPIGVASGVEDSANMGATLQIYTTNFDTSSHPYSLISVTMQDSSNASNRATCSFSVVTQPQARPIAHMNLLNVSVDGNIRLVFNSATNQISSYLQAGANANERVFFVGTAQLTRNDGHVENVALNWGSGNNGTAGVGGPINPVVFDLSGWPVVPRTVNQVSFNGAGVDHSFSGAGTQVETALINEGGVNKPGQVAVPVLTWY